MRARKALFETAETAGVECRYSPDCRLPSDSPGCTVSVAVGPRRAGCGASEPGQHVVFVQVACTVRVRRSAFLVVR